MAAGRHARTRQHAGVAKTDYRNLHPTPRLVRPPGACVYERRTGGCDTTNVQGCDLREVTGKRPDQKRWPSGCIRTGPSGVLCCGSPSGRPVRAPGPVRVQSL